MCHEPALISCQSRQKAVLNFELCLNWFKLPANPESCLQNVTTASDPDTCCYMHVR